MLIDKFNLLEILFQFTLFILLASFVYNLIKEQVLPLLYKEIDVEKQKKKELNETKKSLKSNKINLEHRIEEQKKDFLSIEKKFRNWHKRNVKLKQIEEEKNKLYMQKIEKKREIQSDNLTLLKTEQVVIPKAIKEAYLKIKDLYGGEESRELLKELVEKIEPEKK